MAESIRAVEVLWAAVQPQASTAAGYEPARSHASVMLAISTTYRSSATSRLYASAVGYDAALADAGILLPMASETPAGATDTAGTLLSPREQEVLMGVAKALSNAQIADQLGISPATVKRHLQNIYGKLGAGSRVDAVNKVRRLLAEEP